MRKPTSQRQVRRKASLRIPLYGLLLFIFIAPYLNSFRWLNFDVSLTFLALIALVAFKLAKWVRAKRLVEVFPQYVHAMDHTHSQRTKDLAQRLGQPQEKVIRNLRSMARLGLLPQVPIVRDGDFTLVGADHPPLAQLREQMRLDALQQATLKLAALKREEAAKALEAQQRSKVKAARCSACGAPVRVTMGSPAPCPYCGTLM